MSSVICTKTVHVIDYSHYDINYVTTVVVCLMLLQVFTIVLIQSICLSLYELLKSKQHQEELLLR